MKISVCITNYNKARYIDQSFQNFWEYFNSVGAEVVVVDSESNDGSLVYLQKCRDQGRIDKLIVKRCSRGEGRNLAFRNANGDIIINSIDTDVVYSKDALEIALKRYIKNHYGQLFAVYGAMISTASTIRSIGGWKNLDRHEDGEISLRAMEMGLCGQDFSLNVIERHLTESLKLSIADSMKLTYLDYRDWFRIGLPPEYVNLGTLLQPHVILAYIRSYLMDRYSSPKIYEHLEMIGFNRSERRLHKSSLKMRNDFNNSPWFSTKLFHRSPAIHIWNCFLQK